ncbi:MAG: HU family DNA-binding protein [Bacteroides sp.]|nr:HU family DNA-binding protein [Bacteroides sp.]
MNEKLNIQDIVKLLAQKRDVSEEAMDRFVKAFFKLIEEALEKDKYVKIKGLGTFKLIEVDSRESININTGERFEIQGHKKVSFTPDSNLKEQINKPFAHFETVVLNEGVAFEDMPEGEQEVASIAQEENGVGEVATKEEIQEDENSRDKEEIAEKKVVVEKVKDSVTEEKVVIVEKKKEKQQKSSSVKFLTIIMLVVILLCGGVLAYLYWMDTPRNEEVKDSSEELQQEVAVPPVDTLEINKENELKDTISTQSVIIPFVVDSVSYKIVGTDTVHTIKAGETLTRVALHYYGTKALWPYLVKHNQKIIKDPDNVPYGTTIKVPKLEKK